MAEVFCTACDLIVQNGRTARRRIDPYIRNDEICACAPREHRHPRDAADKIFRLRQGKGGIGGGNTFFDDAVVRCRDDDARRGTWFSTWSAYACKQRRNILQPSQASGRLAQGTSRARAARYASSSRGRMEASSSTRVCSIKTPVISEYGF